MSLLKEAISNMAASSLRCVAIAYRPYEVDKVPTEEEIDHWEIPEGDLILLAIVGIKVLVNSSAPFIYMLTSFSLLCSKGNFSAAHRWKCYGTRKLFNYIGCLFKGCKYLSQVKTKLRYLWAILNWSLSELFFVFGWLKIEVWAHTMGMIYELEIVCKADLGWQTDKTTLEFDYQDCNRNPNFQFGFILPEKTFLPYIVCLWMQIPKVEVGDDRSKFCWHWFHGIFQINLCFPAAMHNSMTVNGG